MPPIVTKYMYWISDPSITSTLWRSNVEKREEIWENAGAIDMESREKKYQVTVGLEIHAELLTKTKMFCECLNDPHQGRPNEHVCPICAGHPGALPVANKKAIESVIKVGLALGGEIFPSGRAKFDRKNYFYPDLPKGYQISQYDEPIVSGGKLLGVGITRIHLEEDAGRLAHAKDASLVDLNRAGVPLMELVTEPDIRSAEQAKEFAEELQRILRYLNVSGGNMERGEMRLEANVSLNMGTKVEVKNINSFKALADAIDYEAARQEELIKNGEKVTQETRGWDDVEKKTVSQRSKEEAHDYRYFPEPDLPPFTKEAFKIEEIRRSIPELPEEKRVRMTKEYELTREQADILIEDPKIAEYFEEAVSELKDKRQAGLVYNYLTSDIFGFLKEKGVEFEGLRIKPLALSELIYLLSSGEINSRTAKDLIGVMQEKGISPKKLVEERGLGQISDKKRIQEVVEKVVSENEEVVMRYRAGNKNLLQFFLGQVMRELKGQGNPEIIKSVLLDILKR